MKISRFQHGFTLLEAVIALAIFAMGATALYAWLNTNLIALARIDAANQRHLAMLSATDFISKINPSELPEGDVQLNHLRIIWRPQETLAQADVLDDQGNKTINHATLILLDVWVYEDDQLLKQFMITSLGMKKVREVGDVLFE